MSSALPGFESPARAPSPVPASRAPGPFLCHALFSSLNLHGNALVFSFVLVLATLLSVSRSAVSGTARRLTLTGGKRFQVELSSGGGGGGCNSLLRYFTDDRVRRTELRQKTLTASGLPGFCFVCFLFRVFIRGLSPSSSR